MTRSEVFNDDLLKFQIGDVVRVRASLSNYHGYCGTVVKARAGYELPYRVTVDGVKEGVPFHDSELEAAQ